jgi:hypothetical protein
MDTYVAVALALQIRFEAPVCRVSSGGVGESGGMVRGYFSEALGSWV